MCSLLDVDCFTEAEEKFTDEAIVAQCNCMPDCSSIEYDTEMSQTQFYQSARSGGEDSR